jgi:hypothetical protein
MLRFKNNDKKNGNFTTYIKNFHGKDINNDALLANIIKGIEEVKK